MKKFLFILGMILSINAVSFAAFSDVTTYTKEIEYLTSKGIINGYEDSTFKPENKITRAELVKMIVTATEKSATTENVFPDVASDHWAKDFINIAVANELIKGDTEGTFRPEDNITYGEVATVLVRAMEKADEAEKQELIWPLNYMKEAEELNLFDGYMTNDLVAVNEARRDNVALMIYNMLNPKEETKPQEEKTEKPEESTKVNTQTAYAGFVTTQLKRSGENRVKIIDNEGTEVELTLSNQSAMPEIHSFVVYQFNLSKEINIRKELKVSDINESFMQVGKIEEMIVQLTGQEKPLDLDLDEYKIGSKTIKLKKINFFVIELDTDENKFVDYKLQSKDELKLKEEDKVKFDEKLNICYIIREVK